MSNLEITLILHRLWYQLLCLRKILSLDTTHTLLLGLVWFSHILALHLGLNHLHWMRFVTDTRQVWCCDDVLEVYVGYLLRQLVYAVLLVVDFFFFDQIGDKCLQKWVSERLHLLQQRRAKYFYSWHINVLCVCTFANFLYL